MNGSEDIKLNGSDISAMAIVMSFSIDLYDIELVSDGEVYVVTQRRATDRKDMLVYGVAYDRKFAEILFDAVVDEKRKAEAKWRGLGWTK